MTIRAGGVVGLVALNFQTTFPSMVRFGFDRGAGAVGIAMSVSAIGSILLGALAALACAAALARATNRRTRVARCVIM